MDISALLDKPKKEDSINVNNSSETDLTGIINRIENLERQMKNISRKEDEAINIGEDNNAGQSTPQNMKDKEGADENADS